MTASHKATHIIFRPYLRLAGPLFRHTHFVKCHCLRLTDQGQGGVAQIVEKEKNYYPYYPSLKRKRYDTTANAKKRGDKTMPARRLSHLTAKQRFLNKKPKPTRSPCYPRLMLFASNSNGGPKLKLSALFNGFQGSTSVRTTRLFSQSP